MISIQTFLSQHLLLFVFSVPAILTEVRWNTYIGFLLQLCLCVKYVNAGAYVPQHVCGSQKTTLSWLPHSTLCSGE